MFYSSEPEALRAFFRDLMEFNAVDIGDGWLIFDTPAGDMGVHPADETRERGAPSGTHDISFFCENLEETVSKLQAKGVEFKHDIEDHGYGYVTQMKVPGDFYIQLYQPKYG